MLALGCDTLLTIGGVQSNHARQTAAAAARLGLHCELLLPRVVPRSSEEYEQSGNVLLDRLFGARLRLLFDLIRRGSFKTSEQVVFWHTGGAPALFAYRDVL